MTIHHENIKDAMHTTITAMMAAYMETYDVVAENSAAMEDKISVLSCRLSVAANLEKDLAAANAKIEKLQIENKALSEGMHGALGTSDNLRKQLEHAQHMQEVYRRSKEEGDREFEAKFIRCSECQWRGKAQCPVWEYKEGENFNDAVDRTDDNFYCADGKRPDNEVKNEI